MSFYTPAGTKVLNLPEQVQKNLEDIAELKTLVGTKQDSSTAVTTANLKESVEAVGSFDLKDISTTSITNVGNLTNTGTADIEGDTNLGSNVEIDGDATLNSPENTKFKTGDLDFSELTNFASTFYSTMGRFRFAGVTFDAYVDEPSSSIEDPNAAKWTDIRGYLAGACFNIAPGQLYNSHITLPDFKSTENTAGMLAEFKNKYVTLGDVTLSWGSFWFWSEGVELLVAEGKTAKCLSLGQGFKGCTKLVTVGAIDVSGVNSLAELFSNCTSLKHIHMTHFQVSFNISASTQFEESDLVEIIGNLDTVTTARILTMGSTNLAKLTEDEILVATGKGWTLA